MIKKLIKILSVILIIIIFSIIYLSSIGIKTEKFNESIINKVLKVNKKIKLELKEIKFLLNPFTLTANITTKDPVIFLNKNKLQIRSIKTSISLRALIFDEFSIGELKISTKPIVLNDVILLLRSLKNSTELFLLDKVIKGGFLVADISLKFDNEGNIKKDYEINGFVKNGKVNFLNQLKVKNLDFNFDIKQKKYSLTKLNTQINNIKLSSPKIEIDEKKDLFFVKGKILNSTKDFGRDELDSIFVNFLKISDIQKIKLSSENDITLNVSKKLKFSNLNIKSDINVDQLVLQNNFVNLKPYLPHVDELITLEKHKILIDYKKETLNIKGKGKILIKNKPNSINYLILKNKNKFTFDTKVNLKNIKLLIDFLDYEKKENLAASMSIKGNISDKKETNFDLISLVENNNTILFKNLILSEDFKIIGLDSFSLNYQNNKKIKNQLFLRKEKSNYTIQGESFDATKLINKIMDSDDNESSSLFSDFNSKVNIKLDKTFLDEINFINNLSGSLSFKGNKINNLDLRSFFPNNKKINLSIKTNNKKEKITKLSTDYPRPLIKRYDFIKGFEKGFLVYQSVEKNGISNSLLTIDNFKVKEVPVFAKLLSLASLQGIADLLTGEGIRFTDFEMKFSKKKQLTTIDEMYAIGPAVSILMDGYLESKKLTSLRGTMVPATTINRTIASIPVLGNILIGKKTGEGVFGVSFKVKGPPNDLKVSVNPIKTLTPRFITRTLEKIKK
jgi:hypothetical protein